MQNPDQSSPSTACLDSFEPHKHAWKVPETQTQASLWIFNQWTPDGPGKKHLLAQGLNFSVWKMGE